MENTRLNIINEKAIELATYVKNCEEEKRLETKVLEAEKILDYLDKAITIADDQNITDTLNLLVDAYNQLDAEEAKLKYELGEIRMAIYEFNLQRTKED